MIEHLIVVVHYRCVRRLWPGAPTAAPRGRGARFNLFHHILFVEACELERDARDALAHIGFVSGVVSQLLELNPEDRQVPSLFSHITYFNHIEYFIAPNLN